MSEYKINFTGKRALVTGATRGIGRQLAEKLSNLGAHVIAVGRTGSQLDELKKAYPSVECIKLDITDWNETKRVISELDCVDFIVNNAAIAKCVPIGEYDEKDCDDHFNCNVKSIINITQEMSRKMIAEKRHGSIVNVSSQASMIGLRDHLVYCATKGAVDQLTRVMAIELGEHMIRVNSVNPTVVKTEMALKGWSDAKKAADMKMKIPLHRFAEIHEVVDVIIFLLSDKASMINGAILPIDGGFTAT